jgi:hypothetical protein
MISRSRQQRRAKRIALEQATAEFVRAVDEAVGLDGVYQIVIGRTWLSALMLDQSVWDICEYRDEREVG